MHGRGNNDRREAPRERRVSADRLRRIRPDAAGGLLLVYLVGVWLMIHWYQGITHDGVLYAGQALARL